MRGRGKLVLFVAVLAAAGSFAGWEFSRDPQLFIGGRAGSAELAAVPRRGGFEFRPIVRVCLTSAPVSQAHATMEEPYTLRVSGGDATQPPERQPAGKAVVSVTPDGFRVGRREFRGTSLELVTDRTPAIWVDDHLYRGSLRFVRQVRKMVVVNLVPLEDYVASVVDGEMPATFPEAARPGAGDRRPDVRAVSNGDGPRQSALRCLRHDPQPELSRVSISGPRRAAYAAESASSRRAADDTTRHGLPVRGETFLHLLHGRLRRADDGGVGRLRRSHAGFGVGALRRLPGGGALPLDADDSAVRRVGCRAALFRRAGQALGRPGFDPPHACSLYRPPQNVREPVFELSDGKRRLKLSAMELRRIFPSAISSFRVRAAR